MAWHLITSLLSLCSELLPSIRASAQAPSSSSSGNNSDKERHAVEKDLEQLVRTLKRIKATLYDANEREIKDCSVKLWLKELKRVAYDAEDVLSEYRYEATRVQVEAIKASQVSGSHDKKLIERIFPIPSGMVERLKTIKSQFDEIAKDREALQLRECDGARRPNNRYLKPPTGHMVNEASIFGREVEIKKVIKLLLSEEEKDFSVISIVGKGGLGKTTIAQLVYKDSRVRSYFDSFGWVCVSEDFNVNRILKATIESISRRSCGLTELSPLQEELANIVERNRILLVLDDVWNENQSLWDMFWVALKVAKLVRILVTTRNEKVAKVMLATACFKPTCLPKNSSWQLFQYYAFDGAHYDTPKHFVEMGKAIMRKCGGLPLAIKSIASLLRHETDEASWEDILQSDFWESNPLMDIFPALHISYAHLPSYLKPCFLLCSMYPKDYAIPKNSLIELWISHGFIISEGKKTIREVGSEYYEELRERSFIDDYISPLEYFKYPENILASVGDHYEQLRNVPFAGDFSRDYRQCRLHDIIHDFAKLNSEKEHYSFEIDQISKIKEIKISQEVNHLHVNGFIQYVNKALQQNLKCLQTLSMDLEGSRKYLNRTYSFMFHLWDNEAERRDLNIKLPEEDFCDIWENTIIFNFNLTKFEALRVLELKGNYLRDIPNSIGQLKHLSHLRITSDRLAVLPLSIGSLYNLQTLIFDCWKSPIEYLPESIGYLANLQYLRIQCACFKKLPKSLFSFTNLLRLAIKCNELEIELSDIRKLHSLQQITIEAMLDTPFLDSTGCLSGLRELYIRTPSELLSRSGKTGQIRLNLNPTRQIEPKRIRT